ncbi:hypothetical protein U1769_08160 [Sphingomonas sp. ZT3P38]|uniref:hypothetical protein n=1 Tax=Parasphingomonas zepuensis TaxID=3096161 RepID=UPI002FCB842F
MRHALALALLLASGAAHAQAIKSEPPVRHFTPDELSRIAMPDLAFAEAPADIATYDKYFFFHRENTSFDEAYADIKECDALASGIRYYGGGYDVDIGQYGLGGAIGEALGNILADAIWGSAERRKIRRANLRNCMFYKEYQRYGMSEQRWKAFNFEEGNGRKKDDEREVALLQQAKVAAGPKPQYKVLEP